MNLLLDSHIFVWWGEGGERLTPRAWQAIASPANSVYVSLVTAWELAIKQSLGKMQLPEPFEALLEKGGFALLQITLDHTRFVATLPFHHRDPFDRLLVAQAQCENLVLVTADEHLSRYDVATLW